MVLFDFNKESDIHNWEVVNDVVMGGMSGGRFEINPAGHALYHGKVSLENNGGFSLVRCRFNKLSVVNYHKVAIRLRGDGKPYQFRVKSAKTDRYCYIYDFLTSDNWQIIEIPLFEMTPRFRGQDLDLPNYPGQFLEEIAFLIANKRAETFKLEVDNITLRTNLH